MNINFTVLLLDLVITMFGYLLIPVILSLRGKPIKPSSIKWISIINTVIVYIIFSALIIETTGEANTSVSCLLWGYIGYRLMKKKCSDVEYVPPVRYCTYCGSPMDGKRCPSCNKKASKNFNAVTAVFLVVSILLLIVTINLSNQLTSALERVDFLVESRDKKTEELRKERIKNNDLSDEIDSLEEKVNFYDENVVFVLKGYGNYYFTYDQVEEVTQGKSYTFWAYNIDAAKSDGYKPY